MGVFPNRRPLLLGLFALFAGVSWSQTAVMAPMVNPAAIVVATPTTVVVRALVTSTTTNVVPNGVNLLQVDATGGNARILGTLNDAGVNGDAVAGDGIFGGMITLNQPTSGQIYLRVSAALLGSLRRTLSPIVPLLVTPANIPNSLHSPNAFQTTIDPVRGGTVICNELLTTFAPTVSPVDAAAIIAANGAAVVGMIPALGLYQVGLPSCDATALVNARTALLLDSRVQAVDFDGVSTLAQVVSNPNDPFFVQGKQWYLSAINVADAWSIAQSRGIAGSRMIGVLDTGINANHEDLVGHVIPGINWCPSVDNNNNCSVPNTNTSDDFGHGTAVAGLAAALSNNTVGVASPAFNALIVAEKITYPNSGSIAAASVQSPASIQAAATCDAIFNGARVINMSFSGRSPALESAIQYAFRQNVIIVAAAGNGASDSPQYPAAFSLVYPNVISVGAMDQSNAMSFWLKSGGGFCNPFEAGSNYGPWVTLYAPGSEMLVLEYNNNSGYGYPPPGGPLTFLAAPDPCAGDGTSFAAPLVTGTIALMLKVNPSLTPEQVKTIIQNTATTTGHKNPAQDPIYVLNAGAAVQQAVTPPTPTGSVAVQATLDGTSWSGALTFTVNGHALLGTSLVPVTASSLQPGSYTLSYSGGGPPNSTLVGITPCSPPLSNGNCTATLGNGQTLTFILQFKSNPPTAGFVMTSGTQSATEGQTLNLSVASGSSANVTFDGTSRSSAVNAASITGWQWTLDGSAAASTSSFTRSLAAGTHSVSLVVTDIRGAQSQAATGTVIVGTVQPTWTHLAVSGAGPVLNSTPVVYDPGSNEIIVFGGLIISPCCTSLNDTWVLTDANGSGGTPHWQHLAVAGTGNPPFPAGRVSHSAAYDQANNRLIVFGGGQYTGPAYNPLFNDVWVLSDANGVGGTPTWTQLFPLTPNGAPAPRAAHQATYDPNTNRMTVFGGSNNGIMSIPNDTWVLTNANGLGGTPQWIPLSPAGGSPARRSAFISTYDPAANAMTVFGGCCPFLGDLWILSSANGIGTPAWRPITQTSPAPGTLGNWNSGYDQTANSLVFFGGSPTFGAFRNDVWVLNNANGIGAPTWVNTIPNGAPGSPPANAPLGAYDAVRKRLMIVPDAADLWVLQQ